MSNFLFILFTIIFQLCLFAGNSPIEKIKNDLKKVNAMYASTSSFSMDIQYLVFDNHINGNLVENKPGKYIKHNNINYTKMLGVETIVNAKHTIIINNEEAFLVITDTKKIEYSPIQTNLDTLLKLCSSIKVVEVNENERHYMILFEEDEDLSEFSQIDVYINLSNYSIKKLVLFYNQTLPLNQNDFYAKEKKPRVEIIYKTFNPFATLNTTQNKLFVESNYLVPFQNSYKGNGKYLSYEVINQLGSYRFRKK